MPWKNSLWLSVFREEIETSQIWPSAVNERTWLTWDHVITEMKKEGPDEENLLFL